MELALVERPTDFSVGRIALHIYRVFRQRYLDGKFKGWFLKNSWNKKKKYETIDLIQIQKNICNNILLLSIILSNYSVANI